MKEFIECVSQIMGVNISDISSETKYKEFAKWDSLMMLTLIMELEDKYSVSIPMDKVGTIKTLSDLYNLVRG